MIQDIIVWFKENFLNYLELETMPIIDRHKIEVMFPQKCNFNGGDLKYNTTTIEDMKRVLDFWILRHKKWSKRFDCDNFADILTGWMKLTNPTQAIGTVWVKMDGLYHALNFFVYYDEKIGFNWCYIEPQTGEIIFPSFDMMPYYIHM